MTTTPNVLNRLHAEKDPKVFRWQFAQAHPVLAFLLITFAWTWLFWLTVIPMPGRNDLLLVMIVLIGGYGPAIGAILTLGLRNGLTLARSRQQLIAMMTAAATIFEVIPLFGLAFILTALARGGMQEPGWRGMLQPALQNKFSPLVASLIVALFWSLWHLPLFLNGFYPEDLVTGMVGGGIY